MPVVCVHGLTRNGRDFDHLAREFVRQGRSVFCPDLVGRGRSDWLRDPLQYQLGQYAADLNNVLTHIGAETVDWVGTSLGGLAGCNPAPSERRRSVRSDAPGMDQLWISLLD